MCRVFIEKSWVIDGFEWDKEGNKILNWSSINLKCDKIQDFQ